VTGFLFAFAATALLLLVMCVTELVAPINRHPMKSKLPGAVFSLINGAATVWLLAALGWAWTLLSVKPLLRVHVSSWTGELAAIGVSLLFYDFLVYWNHRFQHRFLWRFHALHHCQTELNAANSYAHFSERGFRFLLLVLPLSLLQFDFPATPFVIVGLQKILELYIHSPTEIHLGPLSGILVDNRFHRIHHSLEERHFEKNFGILFSIWDRLFGTAYWPKAGEWPETGVAGIVPPRSIGEYIIFPLLRADPAESRQSAAAASRDSSVPLP
jgi:sterol desaturase/sphingolipid hydroxylase (fatty acid hydroxylase superfamily)